MPMKAEYAAWIEPQWREGKLMRPLAALTRLSTDPEWFLSHHPVLGVLDPAQSGIINVCLMNDAAGKRTGSLLGTNRMHFTESFKVQMGVGVNDEGYEFPVHGVRTTAASVPKEWYTLDSTGPALMMTAKLPNGVLTGDWDLDAASKSTMFEKGHGPKSGLTFRHHRSEVWQRVTSEIFTT